LGRLYGHVRVLVWITGLALGCGVSLLIAFPFGDLAEGLLGGGNPTRLAGWSATWALLTATVGAILGRSLFQAAAWSPRLLSMALVGGALAAGAAGYGIVAWAELKFGHFDSEYIGLSILVAPATALIAGATAGLATLPVRERAAAAGLGVMAMLTLTPIALSNVRGLGDGLSDGAWLLGLGLMAACVYPILVLATWRSAPPR
jgi:hypothetical protein